MRILAFDVGERWIGIAVSDELGWTAKPLPALRNDPSQWGKIKNMLVEYHVECMVVGMPYRLDGTAGIQAEKVASWSRKLKEQVDLPIFFVDERLTTRTAERAMIEGNVRRSHRKDKIDSLAAVLILQTYLERKRREDSDD